MNDSPKLAALAILGETTPVRLGLVLIIGGALIALFFRVGSANGATTERLSAVEQNLAAEVARREELGKQITGKASELEGAQKVTATEIKYIRESLDRIERAVGANRR